MSGVRVVAVDGPAAAGKGTLARRLAGALGVATAVARGAGAEVIVGARALLLRRAGV